MRCPQCQLENRDGIRFCEECGAKLEQACPACGSAIPPGRKFCGHCGQALTAAAPPAPKFASPQTYTPKHLAEKILTSKTAMEGERKGVTVMFADVSGFTAMSERLDPEEVHGIMDRAFEVILDSVHRYEGTVNQFLGDGVMALFGAPIAHEDHPHRALCAALAIEEGLQLVREEVRRVHGAEFRVRMGINTGLVVVGAIGKDLRMDYTAVGDTTNLAARLLSLAKPGQIVVSRRTQHLRDGFFVFEDLGEFQVKGKTEPVRAYALMSEVRGRTRLEVSKERGLTPLAGRERELQLLMEAYRRAAEGNGAIVLLVGEPGVGKSRLLYEFLRRIETDGFVELETTCTSYGRSMAYRPILELVRKYLDLSEGMSDGDIRRRVAERLLVLGLEDEERAVLLAHFLGVSAPPEFLNRLGGAGLKERIFGVLRDVFLRAGESSPVILIVENVHWVDGTSEEFLRQLAAGVAGHRVLLVLSARLGSAAPWLLPPLAESIVLEGLDTGDVQGMIRDLLAAEQVSDELFKILDERGAGNPLYVEEILRQLLETGGIVFEDGAVRLSRVDVTVPATIQDIIAARVDRLAEPLKRTLQGAAVVGRRFGVSLLSRVLEAPVDQMSGHLQALHGLDFVFPSGEDPELMYSFKHALTQDVVYGGVLERRRRLFHAAAGLGLEELYAGRTDEVAELLAYHFGRSEEAERAVHYAIKAADKAQRRWASTEALAYFGDALKRLDTMRDTSANQLRRIDAVVKQAEIKFALGQHADYVQVLEAIRDMVEEVADPPRRAAWFWWAGFLHSLTGSRPDVPIAYCREASAIAQASGLEETHAFAESCLAQVYTVAGNLRAALEAGQRALAIFEARGNVWWECRTLWHLSSAANHLGAWGRSLEYCRRALEHGQALNDLRLKVVGWWRTGSVHIRRGDPVEGLRCCEEALALSPIPFDAATAKATHGYGLIVRGDVGAGIAELEDAVAWFEQSNLRYTHALFSLWLVEGYLRQGEPARARAILGDVLRTSREVGYRHVEGIASRLYAESIMGEDPEAAARFLDRARSILESVGAQSELAKAFEAQAALRLAAGDPPGARQLLERALAIFETLGSLDGPPRARAALARIENPPPG